MIAPLKMVAPPKTSLPSTSHHDRRPDVASELLAGRLNSEPLPGRVSTVGPLTRAQAPPVDARSVMVVVVSSPGMFALDATAGLKDGVASATGLSVIVPVASAPHAWLVGGAASAGAPPATRAPPSSASDPAAAAAAVIIRFIS